MCGSSGAHTHKPKAPVSYDEERQMEITQLSHSDARNRAASINIHTNIPTLASPSIRVGYSGANLPDCEEVSESAKQCAHEHHQPIFWILDRQRGEHRNLVNANQWRQRICYGQKQVVPRPKGRYAKSRGTSSRPANCHKPAAVEVGPAADVRNRSEPHRMEWGQLTSIPRS